MGAFNISCVQIFLALHCLGIKSFSWNVNMYTLVKVPYWDACIEILELNNHVKGNYSIMSKVKKLINQKLELGIVQ